MFEKKGIAFPSVFLVLLTCLFAAGCLSEKPLIEAISGAWEFDPAATWKYQNPGKPEDKDAIRIYSMLGENYIQIDSKEQTYSTYLLGKVKVVRYRVIKEEKNRITLNTDGDMEVVELLPGGNLLICPPAGGASKCFVFRRYKGKIHFDQSPPPSSRAPQVFTPESQSSPTFPLEPFLVNLADKPNKRYIKALIEIECATQADISKMESEKPKVRNAVISLLSSKSYADIQSMEAKMALKDEVKNAVNNAFGENVARNVFFTDLVIQ